MNLKKCESGPMDPDTLKELLEDAEKNPGLYMGSVDPMQEHNSIGEQFMIWAEKGWALQHLIENGMKNSDGESCSYDYMRKIFIDKINELCQK